MSINNPNRTESDRPTIKGEEPNLGSQGLRVPAIGLGCTGMSEFYGASSEAQNLRVLDRAVGLTPNAMKTLG